MKLIILINLIFNGQKDIIQKEDENKHKILSNVYEELKEYFEYKNNNKNSKNIGLPEDKNPEDIFIKINSLMNTGKDSTLNISKENKNKEKNKKKLMNSNKENNASNLGVINFNSGTIKFSSSMKINLRKSKSLFRESVEIINEIEDHKDIPWIREEDC